MRAQAAAAQASKAAGATKAPAAEEETKQAAAAESSNATNEFGLEKIEQKTDVAKIAVDDEFDIDDI